MLKILILVRLNEKIQMIFLKSLSISIQLKINCNINLIHKNLNLLDHEILNHYFLLFE